MSVTTLSERLRYARLARNISQAEISKAVGMKQPSYNAIENGKTQKSRFLTDIAQFLDIDPIWLATGQGEMIDNSSTSPNNDNNAKQQTPPQTTNDKSAFKTMPLFDIDDGVAYAICADNHEIMERAKESATFIPSDSRAFGVRVAYEIDGITPVPIHVGDIVIVEPCLTPKDGDLVLLCLGYPDKKRGIFARLYVNIHNEFMVQTINHNPEPMPLGSVICGVVQKVERALLSDRRIDNSYQPISTLVKSTD